jgi:hypothetical protein
MTKSEKPIVDSTIAAQSRNYPTTKTRHTKAEPLMEQLIGGKGDSEVIIPAIPANLNENPLRRALIKRYATLAALRSASGSDAYSAFYELYTNGCPDPEDISTYELQDLAKEAEFWATNEGLIQGQCTCYECYAIFKPDGSEAHKNGYCSDECRIIDG